MNKTIKTVVLWSNGMVGVFDEDGHQIPEFQGPHKEVKGKLKEYVGAEEKKFEEIEFCIGSWGHGTLPMTPQSFFSPLWS